MVAGIEIPTEQEIARLRSRNEELVTQGAKVLEEAHKATVENESLRRQILMDPDKLVKKINAERDRGDEWKRRAESYSDGFHTFDELYEHRNYLFISLMMSNPDISWRANNHSDGTMFDGWFIAGMHLPTGDITYHLPLTMWESLDYKGIATSIRGPSWDGHTAKDVILRLVSWLDEDKDDE